MIIQTSLQWPIWFFIQILPILLSFILGVAASWRERWTEKGVWQPSILLPKTPCLLQYIPKLQYLWMSSQQRVVNLPSKKLGKSSPKSTFQSPFSKSTRSSTAFCPSDKSKMGTDNPQPPNEAPKETFITPEMRARVLERPSQCRMSEPQPGLELARKAFYQQAQRRKRKAKQERAIIKVVFICSISGGLFLVGRWWW